MRVWVIFLLIFVISLTTAKNQKAASSKKSVPVDKSDEDKNYLPPIGDGDPEELPKDEDDERSKKETQRKAMKSKLKTIDAKKEGKDKENEDEESEETPEEARLNEVKAAICQFAQGACEQIEAADKAQEDKAKADSKSKGSKKPKNPKSAEEEEEEEGEQEVTKVCTKKANLCHCEEKKLDCKWHKNEQKLETLNIEPQKGKKDNFKIEVADFTGNAITSLEKGHLLPHREGEVKELIFTKNKISNIETDVFTPFVSLVKLHLDDNEIYRISADRFKGLQGLHQLHLKDNQLSEIPNGAFKGLKSLKKLVLDGNDIGDSLKKETFEGLDSLEELSLDNCNINNTLPENVFDNLLKLQTLSMRNNIFTEVPIALKALSNLRALDISETQVAEIHTKAFEKNLRLKSLRIEKMKYLYAVRQLAFAGLNDLEEVYLSNNKQLYELHNDAFGMSSGSDEKVAQLKILDISNCNISSISEDLLYFEDITTLTMGNNPLECNCDTAFLLGRTIYDFSFGTPSPTCQSPEKFKDQLFVKVQPTEACPQLRRGKTVWRGVKVLSILLLLTVMGIFAIVIYTKGYVQNFLKTARNGAPAFPSMTYSNLSNTEDGRSLEADFQPRPENV